METLKRYRKALIVLVVGMALMVSSYVAGCQYGKIIPQTEPCDCEVKE